jgi:hypothetical protein
MIRYKEETHNEMPAATTLRLAFRHWTANELLIGQNLQDVSITVNLAMCHGSSSVSGTGANNWTEWRVYVQDTL